MPHPEHPGGVKGEGEESLPSAPALCCGSPAPLDWLPLLPAPSPAVLSPPEAVSPSAPLPVGPCLLPEVLPAAPPALLVGGGVLGELDSCGLGGLLALGHPDRSRHRHAAPVA